jgi:hypothetical protein
MLSNFRALLQGSNDSLMYVINDLKEQIVYVILGLMEGCEG